MIKNKGDIENLISLITSSEFNRIEYTLHSVNGDVIHRICETEPTGRYFIVYDKIHTKITSLNLSTFDIGRFKKYLWKDRKHINSTNRIIY